MSDAIKHECGVALLRLRKGASFYRDKYGTSDFGGMKLSLLLEKQHNRGQDGAGAAMLRLQPEPGTPPYRVLKSIAAQPLTDLLGQIAKRPLTSDETVFLGHLRYATFGRQDLNFCHPFVHVASTLERTLLLAGNFNLTNTHELFEEYRGLGFFPSCKADGYLMTELVAHNLKHGKPIEVALKEALTGADGAFTLIGSTASGTAFAIRDPHGIRPGFSYITDEVVVVASERPAIQAAFDCAYDEVKELPPGQVLVIESDGTAEFRDCLTPGEKRSCVFEHIYFSRANDAEIHAERKALGAALVPQIMAAADADIDDTFFSYIPNSAQVSFHGLVERMYEEGLRQGKHVRFGQVAVKDAKFRTFIADAAARKEFYKHIYDVTYGLVREGKDTLVVLDDSIVRGNTMKNAILPMLDRLGPKKIVVVSSAPPIRYPDCYGIDMSTLGELVAFRALVNLLGDGAEKILREAMMSDDRNPLERLYGRFTEEEHAAEITRLLVPKGLKAKVEVVYQTVENLHAACPKTSGDWYFTGNYPTPGGFLVLRRALLNYLERKTDRSY
ncbi:MAG: amidophosphoribosyltransferase [Kiritimatiellia bacterium]